MPRATVPPAALCLRLVGVLAVACAVAATEHRSAISQESGSRLLDTGPGGEREGRTQVEILRLNVPKKEVASVATKHLPMRRDELARGLESLRKQSAERQPRARIDRAEYQVVFDGYRLQGEATWHVIVDGDGPQWLELAPCSLAVSRVSWEPSTEGVPNADIDFQFGVNERGVLGALVPGSGKIVSAWSLPGTVVGGIEAEYVIAAPLAARSSWTLQTPRDWQVSALSEMSVERASGESQSVVGGKSLLRTPLVVESSNGDAFTSWHWNTAGGSFRLQLAAPLERRRNGLAGFDQFSEFQLTLDGLRARFRYQLDLADAALVRTSWALPAGVQVTQVVSGVESLPYSVVNSDGQRHLIVEWPASLRQRRRLAQIEVVQPFPLEQVRALPMVVPESRGWRQHVFDVVVSQDLEVQLLDALDCAPIDETAQGDATPQTTLRYAAESETASLGIAVARRPSLIRAEMGTHLLVGQAVLQAEVTLRVETEWGAEFMVPFGVAPGWQVVSIDAKRPERVESIELARRSDGGWSGVVYLNEPIADSQPLTLTLHCQHASAKTLAERHFRVVQFPQWTVERWVAVDFAEGLRFQPHRTASLLQVEDVQKDERVSLLLPKDEHALVFRDDFGADGLSIDVLRGGTRYDATTIVETRVAGSQVEEVIHIRCEPVETAISQIVVRIEPAPDGPVEWTVVAPADLSLTAREIAQQPADAGTNGSATEYELLLGGEVREPLVLQGRLVRPFTNGSSARLIYLPFARRQQAKWALRAEAASLVDADVTGMRELPLPEPVTEELPLRTWFTYSGAGGATAKLRRVDPRPARNCWAVSALARSAYDMVGGAVHRVSYRIINQGESSLRIELPSSKCRLASVRIDGELQAVQELGGRQYQVALPAGRPGFQLDVRMMGPGPTARFRAHLQPQLPKVSIPVLVRDWRVQLPAIWQVESSERLDWQSRLFFPRRNWSDGFSSERHLKPVEDADWNRQLSAAWEAARAAANGSPVTWGIFLQQLTQEAPGSAIPTCWVDDRGLAQRGITPSTPMNNVATEPMTGEEWFRAYGLRWYATVKGYLLAGETLGGTAPAAARDERSWRKLAEWLALPPRPVAPWIAARAPEGAAAEQNLYDELPFRSEASHSGSVERGMVAWHRGVRIALMIACSLMAAFAVIGFAASRWRYWWWALAVSAIVVQVTPAGWLFVTAAIMWGVALGGLWLGVQHALTGPRRAVDGMDEASRPASAVVATLAGALVVLVWVSGADAPRAAVVAKERWTIVVPVDEDGQPIGEYDYVPRPLYDLLLQQNSAKPRASFAWIVERAAYEAAILPDAEKEGYRLERWEARWQLKVATANEEVQLPMPPLPIDQISVRIDGVPTEALWEVADGAVRVRLFQTGDVAIAMSCRRNDAADVSRNWQIELLPAPLSSVSVALPSGTEGWQVRIDGRVAAVDPASQQIAANVGMASVIELRGPPVRRASGSRRTMMRVVEQQWLRLRPESVVLDYQLSGNADLPPEFELQHSSDLQPLSVRGGDYALEEVAASDGQTRTRLKRRASADATRSLRLRFLWRDRLGIGQFRIPSIQLDGLGANDRQFAVSADERLAVQFRTPLSTGAAIRQFLEQWGEDAETPEAALVSGGRAPGDENVVSDVVLVSRLEPVTARAETEWRCRLSRHAMHWQLDVKGEVRDGWRLHEELVLPRDLRVQGVERLGENTSVPLRYSRSADGRMLIFFDRSVSGSYTLRIRGDRSLRFGNRPQRLSLPTAELPRTQVQDVRYQLWRDADVLLAPSGLDEDPTAVRPRWANYERGAWWLGTYRLPASAQPPSVTVRLNAPRLRGGMIHHVYRDDSGWNMDLIIEVTVVNAGAAQVDSLRMSVPAGWLAPAVLTEGCRVEVQDAVQRDRRYWELIPQTPITQSRTMRVRVRLDEESDGRLQASAIQLHDVANVRRFFVLPARIPDGRPIWETRGLFRGRLPPNLSQSWSVPPNSVVYRVVPGSDAMASLMEIRRQRQQPRAALADALVQLDHRQRVWMVARWTLMPGDLTSAEFLVPASLEVVAASLDRRPARLWRVADGRWRVRLFATREPQFLEVVCRGPAAASLPLPQLRGFSVQRTVCTVISEPGMVVGTPQGRRITPRDAARLRLEVYQQLAAAAGADGRPRALDAAREAYHSWFDFARAAVGEWARDGDAVAALPWTSVPIGRPQGEAPQAEGVLTVTSVADAPWLETWHQVIDRRGEASSFAFEGNDAVLRIRKSTSSSVWKPALMILVWIVAAMLGHFALGWLRVRSALDCPGTWAWLAGIVLYAATGALAWSLLLLALAIVLSVDARVAIGPLATRPSDSRSRG